MPTGGILEQVIKVCEAVPNGKSHMGKCPAHDDKLPSLAFWIDGEGRLAVKCYAGCTRGDVIQALADAGVEGLVKSKASKGADDATSKKIQASQAVWDQAGPIEGTPAEHYLRGRSIDQWPNDSVRYWSVKAEGSDDDQRALINPILDWQGRLQGIQRLYITADGDKASVTPQRRINGLRRGGGTMLLGAGPPIVCEGLETALSIWISTGRHTVATLGLANLDKLPLGSGMEVVVARDLDKAGGKADKQLWRAVRSLRGRGVKVLVATPPKYDDLKKTDFNDVLKREGKAKIKELIDTAEELDEKDQAAKWSHQVIDPIQSVKDLNEKYLVVKDAGKTVVLEEKWDPVLHREVRVKLSFTDFRNYFMNQQVQTGAIQTKPLGEFWLESANRRQYEHVVFQPTGGDPADYNLWRGWAYEPEPGDWSLLNTHIKDNICGGDAEKYNYLMGWLAHKVQRLDSQGHVGVVLRGRQGVGKGTLGHAFGKLFGQHYLHVSHSRHVTGNFNSHLRDCLFLFADEAFWAGDKQGEAVLKTIITEPTLTIEGKGKDVVIERNRVAMLVASNQAWVVPSGLEERRFFVLDVDDKRMQDTQYFKKLMEQLEADGGKGYQGFLHDLQAYDLTNFNINKVPQTKGLLDQKLASMSAVDKWWFECLQIGKICPEQQHWTESWTGAQLHGSFLEWAAKIKLNRLPAQTDLMRSCHKLIPNPEKKDEVGWKRVRLRADSSGQRPWGYQLPSLEDCRKHFEVLVKQVIDWEQLEEAELPSTQHGAEDDIPF